MNPSDEADADPVVIVAISAAVLLAATTHDIATTPANTYTPEGLRVAPGDTVRWVASATHPLVFDGETGGPYTGGIHERTLNAPGQLRFHCDVHGAFGMTGAVTVGSANAAPTIAVQRDTAAPAPGKPVRSARWRAIPSGWRCGSTGTWTATGSSSARTRARR